MVCVRSAWLTLGTASIPLENKAAGYFCSELSLGSPTVRETISNRPDQDGADDRTIYSGPRAVSAKITALFGAHARIDEIAASFGPFMVPSARPQLHYVLDRGANPERVLTVRASAYDFAIAGDNQRDIALSWVAPDPVAYDPTTHSATSWAGTSPIGGRSYNLTFNRSYGVAGMGPVVATITGAGDLPLRPHVRIYGPITDPVVTFTGGGSTWLLAFVAGFRIDAGQYISISTAQHAAYKAEDTTQSVLSSLDWSRLVWPVLPSGVAVTMALTGTGTTQASQAVATWRNGYLS